MQNTKLVQTVLELFGDHRGAVVRHDRARQRASHEPLAEAVHQMLGCLVKVPLDMARQPRAIVDDAQAVRLGPTALRGQHVPRTFMEVEMPQ